MAFMLQRLIQLSILSLLSLQISSCATKGNIEDADLFSIGNIPRWEREQREREEKAVRDERKNIELERKFIKKIQQRSELRAQEIEILKKMLTQEKHLTNVAFRTQEALSKNNITKDQHLAVERKLRSLMTEINHFNSIRDYTQPEIEAATATSDEATRVIKELDDVHSEGYVDISKFIKTLD